jgi:hypothetical protein
MRQLRHRIKLNTNRQAGSQTSKLSHLLDQFANDSRARTKMAWPLAVETSLRTKRSSWTAVPPGFRHFPDKHSRYRMCPLSSSRSGVGRLNGLSLPNLCLRGSQEWLHLTLQLRLPRKQGNHTQTTKTKFCLMLISRRRTLHRNQTKRTKRSCHLLTGPLPRPNLENISCHPTALLR